jgi:hypothetical protein
MLAKERSVIYDLGVGKHTNRMEVLLDGGGLADFSIVRQSVLKNMQGAQKFEPPRDLKLVGIGGKTFAPKEYATFDVYFDGVYLSNTSLTRVEKRRVAFAVVEDSQSPHDVILCEKELVKLGIDIFHSSGKAIFDPSLWPKFFVPSLATDLAGGFGKVLASLGLAAEGQANEHSAGSHGGWEEGDTKKSFPPLKRYLKVEDVPEALRKDLLRRGLMPRQHIHGVYAVSIHFSIEQLDRIDALMEKYKHLFDGDLTARFSRPFAFKTNPSWTPRKTKWKRRRKPMDIAVLKKKLGEKILRRRSRPPVSTKRWHCVRKPGFPAEDPRGWRLVVDIAANAHMVADAYPMNKPRLIAEERSRWRFGIETDVTEAYNAIPLAEESAGLTCIEADELGVLEYCGLPMGAKNAGEELYRRVAENWDQDAVKASYADNLLNFVMDLEEGIVAFEALLVQTDKAGVRLNIGDTEVCNTISQFLGYESQFGSYTPGRRLMGALLDMRPPNDRKELESLLASANVLRRFVPDFNALIEPFAHLLQKKNPFNWTILEEAAFITLKRVMTSPAVVRPFDPELETAVYTDFNGTKNGRRAAVGCSLWQRHGETWHPVLFSSRYLSLAETRFITKESAFSSSAGECIAFAFAVREFYFELSQCPTFQVLADARNLTYWRTSSLRSW